LLIISFSLLLLLSLSVFFAGASAFVAIPKWFGEGGKKREKETNETNHNNRKNHQAGKKHDLVVVVLSGFLIALAHFLFFHW
jgi:hypothetical protein